MVGNRTLSYVKVGGDERKGGIKWTISGAPARRRTGAPEDCVTEVGLEMVGFIDAGVLTPSVWGGVCSVMIMLQL